MLDAVALARLDELRRVAYGRGSALTPSQAAELRELEHRRRASAAEPAPHPDVQPEPSTPEQPDPSTPERDAPSTPEPDTGADDAPAVGSVDDRVPASFGSAAPDTRLPRRRARIVTAAVIAVAAVIGVGLGWAAVPDADAHPALPAAQADVFVALDRDGGFDAGSLVYLGSQHGAALWTATRREGAQECLALTAGDLQNVQCLPVTSEESAPNWLGVGLELPTEDGARSIWAARVTDVEGRRVSYMQAYDNDAAPIGWQAAYSEEELAQAQVLVDAGYAGDSLSLIGYDGDRPVWTASGAETCLAVVVDGAVHEACGQLLDGAAEPLELTFEGTTYSASMTDNRGVQLTVYPRIDAIACVVDDDGATPCTSIDDKTGQTGD